MSNQLGILHQQALGPRARRVDAANGVFIKLSLTVAQESALISNMSCFYA